MLIYASSTLIHAGQALRMRSSQKELEYTSGVSTRPQEELVYTDGVPMMVSRASTRVVFQQWPQEELEYRSGVPTMVSGRTRVHEWCSNDGLRSEYTSGVSTRPQKELEHTSGVPTMASGASTLMVFHVTSVPLLNFIFRDKSSFLNFFVKLFKDETK
jgi:hypothetical protein